MPSAPNQRSADRSEGDVNLSSRRDDWQQQNIDSSTQQLLDKDSQYFLHQALSTPCLNALQSCQGIYLEDTQGRRYMDFHGNSVHQVGFGHPSVIDAIKRQLDELPFCTRRYTNRPAIDLAAKLAQIAPGDLNKVLLAPGGTSAIGMALKLARLATGRHKTISMWDSFHGASLDCISIGGEAIFRRDTGPLMSGCEHVPPADSYRCLWDCASRGGCDLKCAQYIEYILEKEGDIAAVIAEPIRSTPYVPPLEYWQAVREACDRHGTLLIFDEICLGLGRTGKMFACEHFGVVPDMLVLGKGLGGGVFPQAALLAREKLDIVGDRALGHYTHEKNPVAAAAALATIGTIEEEHLVENAEKIGALALKRMRSLQERYPLVGDTRGVGLLLGMELVLDSQSKKRAIDQAERIMYSALTKGLSFKLTMGNIITLSPPLIITAEQMNRALDILEECLQEVSR